MPSEADGATPTPPGASVPAEPPDAPARSSWRRRVQLGVLIAGGVVILAVNGYLILGGPAGAATREASPAASASAPSLGATARERAAESAAPASSSAPAAPSSAPVADADAGAQSEEPPPTEAPAPKERKGDRARAGSVEQVVKRACSTAPIDGLSRQIVAEARCLDATAFTRVPARRNLESAGHVFLYLDAPARDHLLRVLDAHPNRVMKVHSALRTVAQQYLLYRWAREKRCGIQLATPPGESNHETGLALDVSGHAAWRSALEAEGFRWLGAIDRVHFDFVGPGATHHQGLDVRAFQRLWNRNHAGEAIEETGRYDAATELALKRAPAAGFPIGARCGGGGAARTNPR